MKNMIEAIKDFMLFADKLYVYGDTVSIWRPESNETLFLGFERIKSSWSIYFGLGDQTTALQIVANAEELNDLLEKRLRALNDVKYNV